MKVKKLMCILLAFCLVAALCSCSDTLPGAPEEEKQGKQNPGEFSFIDVSLGDMSIEEWLEEDTVCSVTWDKIKLSDEYVEKYPDLKKAFDKINEKTSTDAKAHMYELSSAAKELRGESEAPVICESESRIFMQRADSSAISWLEEEYIFSGGVHPDYFYKGINLNPQSGADIPLGDVVKDVARLPEILEKKITEKYSYVTFGDLGEIFGTYTEENYSWTLDYQGITFWFSPYEIAAYSVGLISAKIYFGEESELFNPEYTSAPSDTYAISLPIGNALGQEIEFDLDTNDGRTDLVFAGEIPEQSGSYYMLKAVVNSSEYIDEINYAYGFDAYLVHKNNRNYIYTVSYSDGSYNMFHALDINNGEIRQISEMYGTQFDSEIIEEEPETYVVYRPFFNNPESFKLSTGIELIGNRDAVASYKTGDDGKPVMMDEFFDIETDYSQTTKIPLEAMLLPEKEWTTLPAGTELWGMRTDAETYIDMKTADGKEVRFNIDVSGWPKKVNGMPEEECFENIMYAG